MPDESKIEGTVNAVKGLVEAVPIYQDAIQPAAKEIGTALQTVAKSVHILLAPVAGLVWGYDKIKDFVTMRVAEKLKEVPPARLRSPEPSVAGPVLEALRYSGHTPELREMYATLLASAMDRNFDERVRVAFVEIIRQLEVTDAHILHAAFLEYVRIQEYFDLKPYLKRKPGWNSPLDIAIDTKKVRDVFSVDERQFETSLDNLQRLRCLTPFVETKGFDGASNGLPSKHLLSAFYSYEQISITSLGISFVETCVRDATFLSAPPCES